MFNTITTKNLYIAELRMVEETTYESISESTNYFSNRARYSLVKKKDFEFVDIFTGTKYPGLDDAEQGEECVFRRFAIMTDRDKLTYDETVYILQELNPTYIHKEVKDVKLLFRRR